MVIGMFSESYLPMLNGVVTSIHTLRKGLEALGHTVYVICTDAELKEEDNDPYVIRLKGFTIPTKSLSNFKLVRCAYRKFKKQMPNINFDIIHIHTEFSLGGLGIKLSKKYNIPLVYTFHTMYEEYGHYVLPFGLRHIGKPFYMIYVKKKFASVAKNARSLILPTEKVADMVKRYKVDKPYDIIPTGIDFEKFNEDKYTNEQILEIKKKHGLENHITLLYVGRISKEKSLDELINMYNNSGLHNKCKLLIVGNGPYYEEIRSIVKKDNLDNDVIFTGPVPNDLVGLYYRVGDVFVNASKTETQGLTYVEALASSLPVLAKYDTNLDDIIINYENGIFYNNEEEFIEKLKEITTNKDLRYKLKQNARASVEKYSSNAFANEVLKVYNRYVTK